MVLALIWTIIFAFAVLLSFRNYSEAIKDRNALKETKKNGPFKIVADWSVRSELVRLAVYILYFALGVAAVIDTSSPLLSYAGFILTLGGFGMMVNTFQASVNRSDVMHYGEKHADSNSQQSPSRRKTERVVRGTGRSRLGNGPKRQNRHAPRSTGRSGR